MSFRWGSCGCARLLLIKAVRRRPCRADVEGVRSASCGCAAPVGEYANRGYPLIAASVDVAFTATTGRGFLRWLGETLDGWRAHSRH